MHERAACRPPCRACPSVSTFTRSGPRDGLQNEDTVVPVEVEGRVHPPAGRRRARGGRVDQLCPAQLDSPARRRRRAARATRPAPRASPGARPQRARPGPRPRRRGHGDRRLRQRHRDASPSATSTGPWPRPWRCSPPWSGGPGPRVWQCAVTSPCASGDPWEGDVARAPGGRRGPGAGGARLHRDSPSATPSASPRRARWSRCSTRSSSAACRCRPLPCTSTTPTDRRWRTP